ncbi:hypothetical protein [Pyruvatibacter mobilis]|uniref:hypothetical protein n=1 Tax=Pyruvatibacter mobilis TaxID=1712261 RepID=UPI003BAB0C59
MTQYRTPDDKVILDAHVEVLPDAIEVLLISEDGKSSAVQRTGWKKLFDEYLEDVRQDVEGGLCADEAYADLMELAAYLGDASSRLQAAADDLHYVT